MIRIAAALLLFAASASAQSPEMDARAVPAETPPALPPQDPGPYLTIETVGAGTVLVDGVAVDPTGRAILGVRRAAGDTVRVSLVEDVRAWDARRTDAVVVMTGADDAVRLELPVRTRVETLPLGADLTLVTADGERRSLGAGPVSVDLAPGTSATVVATMDGHLDARAELPSAAAVSLLLPPVGQPDADPVALLPMRGSTRARTLVDVGIGAAAVAAGALAIHFKFRADGLDDLYRDADSQRRGDPELLSDINRNDALSNVALAGMQIGLGVLAVRFILR